MMRPLRIAAPVLPVLVIVVLPALPACSTTLPRESPPLVDMEEPLAMGQEPDDEAARRALPLGSFAGLYLRSAWFEGPAEPGRKPDALEVERVVENSPGAAAGLQEGDLLLAVAVADGVETELRWPSQWRKIEAESKPGTVLHVRYDRAARESAVEIVLAARVAPAPRQDTERFREEQRAGIVVRTATAVEARSAGLGEGGGAVLVGMAANSPWRRAGLRFGDLIVAAGRDPVHHPQVLLSAIRTQPQGKPLAVTYWRDGVERKTRIAVTERDQEITSVSLWPLFSYRSQRDTNTTSILLGLIRYQSTTAAWEFGFLWFFSIAGGDSDRLEEVDR